MHLRVYPNALATLALLLDEDDIADSLRGLICLAATKRYLVEAQEVKTLELRFKRLSTKAEEKLNLSEAQKEIKQSFWHWKCDPSRCP
jgi:hypothetical protein